MKDCLGKTDIRYDTSVPKDIVKQVSSSTVCDTQLSLQKQLFSNFKFDVQILFSFFKGSPLGETYGLFSRECYKFWRTENGSEETCGL